MKTDKGITPTDARKAYAKLGEWDKEKIAKMCETMTIVGLSEGESLAILGAIGAKMVTDPGHELWRC